VCTAKWLIVEESVHHVPAPPLKNGVSCIMIFSALIDAFPKIHHSSPLSIPLIEHTVQCHSIRGFSAVVEADCIVMEGWSTRIRHSTLNRSFSTTRANQLVTFSLKEGLGYIE
jgi:hypothetical protein